METAQGLGDQGSVARVQSHQGDLIPISERRRLRPRVGPQGPLCSGENHWGGPVVCQLQGCHGYRGMPRAEQAPGFLSSPLLLGEGQRMAPGSFLVAANGGQGAW